MSQPARLMDTHNNNKFFTLQLYLIIFLATLALLPSLKAGLIADDYWHAIWVKQLAVNPSASNLSPFDLFAFFDGTKETRETLLQQGALPWWTADDLTLQFWRPVSELSHIDYLLPAEKPWLMHLHNILWFVAVLFILAAYLKRLTNNNTGLLLITLCFFVAEPFHAIAVTWIANRNILIGAVFVLLCLIQHIDYRNTQHIKHQILSLIFLVLALLSAEMSLSVVGFLAAYAICIDQNKGRFKAIVPHAIIVLCWLLTYKLIGFGAMGSANMYLDPFSQPYQFLAQYIERVFVVLSLQITIFPKFFPDIWATSKLAAAGFMLLLGFVAAFIKSKNRLLGFALLSFVIAVLPLASALLHERNFIFVSISIALMLAILLQSLREFAHRIKSKILTGALFFLVFIRVFLTFLLVPLACIYLANIGNTMEKSIGSFKQIELKDKHVITVGMPIMHSTFIYPYRVLHNLDMPLSMLNLVSDTGYVEVRCMEDRTLKLESANGLFQGDDLFLRDVLRKPFEVGDRFLFSQLKMEVKSTNEDGNITALVVSLPQPNTNQHAWFKWDQNRVVSYDPLSDCATN